MERRGEIVLYTLPDGSADVQVTYENESLWLTEQQIATLFERDRTVVGRHIRNIFKEGELEIESNVQKMHIAHSDKPVSFYNLDLILSVGYRVNSKRGTQFRIWANRILKDHLIKGYTLNERLLKEKNDQIALLKASVRIVERSVRNRIESLDEVRSLLSFLDDFSSGLGILDDYDHERLDSEGRTTAAAYRMTVEECRHIIDGMRDQFDSAVFGKEKDGSFSSSINQIYQAVSGTDLYPSLEEKAAMLLYFVVKNHSFVDGNKRIAASIFLYFLDKNGLLYGNSGNPSISNEGLASMTLMIAESRPEEMETIKRVLLSLLNRRTL